MEDRNIGKNKVIEKETMKAMYEKPLFQKHDSLMFPDKIWEKLNKGKFTQTCSKCHHCR